MSIKLLALDLDGTLLDSKKNMPKDFIPWVKAHSDIRTVIASGRQYYTILRDFPEGSDMLTIIAENGGMVRNEKGEILYINTLAKEDIKKSLDRIFEIDGVYPVLCGENSAYICKVNDEIYAHTCVYYARIEQVDDLYEYIEKDNIMKIAIFFSKYDAAENMERLENISDNIIAVLSGDCWADIANVGINKGLAIEKLLEVYNIDRSEASAFGDYLNDYEMLNAVEESYCMINGHEDLKKIAKHIAPSNDEAGVMQVLNSWD